jgi:hypothetical protein
MAACPAAARSTRRRLAVYPGLAAGLRVYFQEEGDDKEWVHSSVRGAELTE